MAKKIDLTAENYYSAEMGKKYCSVSQLKNFIGTGAKAGCEVRALKEIDGEYVSPTSDALLLGSYVDCALTEPERMDEFKKNHPELYSSRGATAGELKATFKIAPQMVERAKRDKFFMKTLEGDHQSYMIGEIEGVPFKIKMDAYKKGKFITDLKTCKSIREFYWNPMTGRKESFVEFYDYILQGAIYQEIVRQNTGETLPFFISAISKETPTDIEVIQIDNDIMAEKLDIVRPAIAHVGMLKRGEIEPTKCGCCEWCIEHKVLTKPINWLDLAGNVEETDD